MRGVVDDYMVLPSGSELTGQLKLITTDALLTGQSVSLGDLALFELAGRHSFGGRVEVAGAVDLLPKQPTTTDESAWQSASGDVRIKLARHVALAIGGAGGHLFDHDGEWLRQTAMIDVKHPLNRYVAFDIQGGADGIELAAPGSSGAHLTELALQTSTLFRADEVAGAWAGVAYSIPVLQGGVDPTTQMALDPKPRLDLAIGAVLAVVPEWDLFVSYAVITRGDVQDRASMLPILDGGFNQHQLVVGVTRHFEGGKKHGVTEPLEM